MEHTLRLLLLDSEEIYLRGMESALSSNAVLSTESVLLDADSALPHLSGRFDLVVVGVTHRGWRLVQSRLLSLSGRYDRALALVSDCARPHIQEILRTDFDSLVHRSATCDTVNRAVIYTLKARRYVDEPIGTWLLAETASRWSAFNLTAREREIADLLMTDLTLHDMARHLRVTYNTVKYHVTNVYRKVGVPGRRALRDVGNASG